MDVLGAQYITGIEASLAVKTVVPWLGPWCRSWEDGTPHSALRCAEDRTFLLFASTPEERPGCVGKGLGKGRNQIVSNVGLVRVSR